jgi:hypothetical protein
MRRYDLLLLSEHMPVSANIAPLTVSQFQSPRDTVKSDGIFLVLPRHWMKSLEKTKNPLCPEARGF